MQRSQLSTHTQTKRRRLLVGAGAQAASGADGEEREPHRARRLAASRKIVASSETGENAWSERRQWRSLGLAGADDPENEGGANRSQREGNGEDQEAFRERGSLGEVRHLQLQFLFFEASSDPREVSGTFSSPPINIIYVSADPNAMNKFENVQYFCCGAAFAHAQRRPCGVETGI